MMVNIGGYKLYITCTGKGSPTVVMEAGAFSDSSVWGSVLQFLPGSIRACVYGRAGMGVSDQRPSPPAGAASSQDVVRELHALLANARVPGPNVLVGHSLGGLIVFHYAYTYPTAVLGMVLLDPAYPTFCTDLKAAGVDCGGEAFINFGLSDRQVQKLMPRGTVKASLGDRPLIVLEEGTGTLIPLLVVLKRVWHARMQQVASASSNSLLVTAATANHEIEMDSPFKYEPPRGIGNAQFCMKFRRVKRYVLDRGREAF